MEKRRRALASNTVGFEKKAAGFAIKHGGLCDPTPQALKKTFERIFVCNNSLLFVEGFPRDVRRSVPGIF
ncbi:hypothetical protein [Bacteroides pyogenes]|uniref:hypothetical protein n=1 Tax=Bacteroides pyogenes TaxID=310300 RepID=UPI001BA5F697|nr:hypothetical protein [Bacteroides pyogenes]